MKAMGTGFHGHVVVCSKNPVKILAVKEAFSRALPHLKLDFTGVGSASGVSDQPWGDEETLAGALNRVASVGPEHTGDLIVALEGGVGPTLTVQHPLLEAGSRPLAAAENTPPNCPPSGSPAGASGLECFAWAVVRAPGGALSRARSASFVLPPRVAELVQQGMELGAADDAVFSRVNSGQGSGTIGRLTLVGGKPLITRQAYYEHAVVMSLVPLMNAELYPGFELAPPS